MNTVPDENAKFLNVNEGEKYSTQCLFRGLSVVQYITQAYQVHL
jgi:hypothetical protein